MPDKTDPKPKDARPLAGGSLTPSFGATEFIYVLGLVSLAAGIGFEWGWNLSFVVCGAVMLFTAFWNAKERA